MVAGVTCKSIDYPYSMSNESYKNTKLYRHNLYGAFRVLKIIQTLHILLKVPGPIASEFFQTFGDFGIRKKLIFLITLGEFYS